MSKTSLQEWCIQNNQEEMLIEYLNGHNDLSSDEISYGSTKKVNWQCKLGHQWTSSPNNRTHQKCGCPICGNKQLVIGINDLQTLHPELALEWDYEKNAPLLPHEIISGSNKSIHWKCKLGHEYEQKISVRINQNTGCPVCAGLKVEPGYNDLGTTHPDLAMEWDYQNNNGLTPQDVIAGTHQKATWICPKGHRYTCAISSRTYGNTGCPYCANQKVLPKYNDLETVHPHLAQEWDYEHNGHIAPKDVIAGSNKSYYWICDKGHSYKASVSSRLRGRNCPYCAGKKVLIGFNDLLTTEPQLATEWHTALNGELKPTDVTRGSDKKVWWKCSKNPQHEWQAIISSRANGNGCPECAKSQQTSLAEKTVAFYMLKAFPDIQCNAKFDWSGKMEADIYIPSQLTAIEYDGAKWHQDIERDKKKDKLFAAHGIRLIRIREEGCPEYMHDNSIHLSTKQIHGNIALLTNVIKEIFKYLNVVDAKLLTFDINSDYSQILHYFTTNEIDTPFLDIAPHLNDEWNYEKNGQLNPNTFSFGSQKKVWWRCNKCNHEYQAVIASRVKGTGCLNCYKIDRRNKQKGRD